MGSGDEGRRARFELDREPRAGCCSLEHLTRLGHRGAEIVRSDESAEGLADLDCPSEAGHADAFRCRVDQASLTPPGEQVRRPGQPLALVLEVDGVDELLDDPQWLRRRLRYVVAWTSRHRYKYFTGV